MALSNILKKLPVETHLVLSRYRAHTVKALMIHTTGPPAAAQGRGTGTRGVHASTCPFPGPERSGPCAWLSSPCSLHHGPGTVPAQGLESCRLLPRSSAAPQGMGAV